MKFTFKEVGDLGFVKTTIQDIIYYDRHGFNDSIVDLQLDDTTYLEWDQITREVEAIKLNKSQDIIRRIPIRSREVLDFVIEVYLGKAKVSDDSNRPMDYENWEGIYNITNILLGDFGDDQTLLINFLKKDGTPRVIRCRLILEGKHDNKYQLVIDLDGEDNRFKKVNLQTIYRLEGDSIIMEREEGSLDAFTITWKDAPYSIANAC